MSALNDHRREGLDATARDLLGTLPERWGRMDLMSRTALVETGKILRANSLLAEDTGILRQGLTGGLIVGTRRGSLAVDLEYAESVKAGPGLASPHLFSYTLPNIPLAETAIQYGLTGPVFCLISDDPHAEALQDGRLWLDGTVDEIDFIVAGALDVLPAGAAPHATATLEILQS